jgi:hypothetical protein
MTEMFRRLWGSGEARPERDRALERALGTLDPAAHVPGYWTDFRRRVMLAAAPELARRRRWAEVTVSDVVFSWSRTLVPSAMMAAAVAGFLLMRAGSRDLPAPLRLEQILWEGIDLTSGPQVDLEVEISFAAESF